MTGQLILSPLSSKGVTEGRGILLGHPTKFEQYPNKSTRLVFHFSPSCQRGGRGVILFFNDQRKFGWVQVFSSKALMLFQSKLGYDILDPQFTPEYLFSQLHRSSRAVKLVLLDQNFFAGIGNIYANDALFLCGIHPSIPANQVSRAKAPKLYRAILSIMQQSILAGGSTMKDNKYVRPDGTFGNNQFSFRVYQRSGEPCLACNTLIERIVIGGRGTFLCPKCQSL
jgi:formamidopyrimidine-DNA glycosylase